MENTDDRFDEGIAETDVYGEEYDPEVLEQIRLAKIRRQRADQLARDRLHAEMVMVATAILIVVIIISLIVRSVRGTTDTPTDSSATVSGSSVTGTADNGNTNQTDNANTNTDTNTANGTNTGTDTDTNTADSLYSGQAEGHTLTSENGVYYVDGIMIVNKTFSLPSDYGTGLDAETSQAFDEMAAAAWQDGVTIWICSGYRSYADQETLFDQYASQRGLDAADEVSARPGHSEHQSGLCIDVNSTEFSFGETEEAQWLAEHCAEYGFIIRFPEGKEDITGYSYEPWHIRYVGVEAAQAITSSGLCLEEYLGVTSDYADSPDCEEFAAKYGDSQSDN